MHDEPPPLVPPPLEPPLPEEITPAAPSASQPEVAASVTAQVAQSFQASAEDVFAAWVTPEHIAAWFAPGLGAVTAEVNAGVGGELAITQQREDGAVTHIGRFQQVIHPRRLIFSWTVEGDDGEDRIIVDITPKPIGCDVTLSYEMDAEWAELVDDAQLAWSIMLQAMARHLDAQQG